MSSRPRTRPSRVFAPVSPPTSLRQGLAALGLAVATLAPLAGWAAPAGAATVSGEACEVGEGVTVVVDFADLGGVAVGCAPGAQASGFAALAAAGFSVGFEGGPGMVCTIDGRPAEGYPYCWSSGGYWSYWKKDRGGTWDYSRTGGGAGPLAVDAVEGWRWAGGFTSAPPAGDETSAPPPTTTTTTTTTAPASTSTTSGPGGTTSTTGGGSSTTTPATGPGSSSSVPGPAGPAGPSSTVAEPRPPTAADPSVAATRSGLARTGVDPRRPASVAVALVIGGAALVASSRRRARSGA